MLKQVEVIFNTTSVQMLRIITILLEYGPIGK